IGLKARLEKKQLLSMHEGFSCPATNSFCFCFKILHTLLLAMLIFILHSHSLKKYNVSNTHTNGARTGGKSEMYVSLMERRK
ncbi:MAG: hypothetical protein ACK56F_06745, partial [bacterium]